jgi:pimeloyl-ACP methyl ester carboxylesterase
VANNVRTHGTAPFKVAVIHGGPGAAGEMRPVAGRLGLRQGVLEPLQTASSVEGQIEELDGVIQKYGDPPVLLIGHSWGAWLSVLYTACNHSSVRKVVLVSSGPFEQAYVPQITQTRLERMNDDERQRVFEIGKALEEPNEGLKDRVFAQMGAILLRIDSCQPLIPAKINVRAHYRIFQRVWTEAEGLRRNGMLLEQASQIRCPVVAIHGDYDPHPAEGVQKPLSKVIRDFRFILLEDCGHYPWIEKKAKEIFYELLQKEIQE